MFDAAQRREIRERRERLREGFMVGRDAYIAGNLGTGKVQANGYRQPSYLEEERGAGLTGQALWDAIDRFEAALASPR